MKQMKEENDHWRKWKQQKDKEVMQLMQKVCTEVGRMTTGKQNNVCMLLVFL